MDSISKYGISIEHNAVQSAKGSVCMHEHNVYELYYLVSGKRRYLMQHTVFDVEPGNMLLIPPGQLHRVTSTTNTGYHRYALYFTQQHAALAAELFGGSFFSDMIHKGCIQLPVQVCRQIESSAEEINRQLQSPSWETKAVITHLLHGILLCALRYGQEKKNLDGESADKVQMIAKYIGENYGEDISLGTASEMANMERTYFCKRFKAVTGVGFQDYLLQIRLNAAKQLLLDTQCTVGQIAEKCGFTTSNYFGDVFRRYHGMSPTEYRVRNTKES